MKCKHMNFNAGVKVIRLEDSGRFSVEMLVNCKDCGEPFQFIGLPVGLNLNGATVSFSGLQARLAIAPSSETTNPVLAMMGGVLQ